MRRARKPRTRAQEPQVDALHDILRFRKVLRAVESYAQQHIRVGFHQTRNLAPAGQLVLLHCPSFVRVSKPFTNKTIQQPISLQANAAFFERA
ncbi:hypothetical protein SDC9_99967 [bioreactor metagenome]|uniref:Uncharacterized protein n=1 Tax=bioreactor metagenome TaxID=1076179 RepID=A0A645AIZ4_9ZZZZ